MQDKKTKNGKLMLAVSMIVCVFVVTVYSSIPNPGHSANQVGSGTFYGESGDVWSFPGKVGIGITSPDYSLTVGNYVKVGSGIDGEYGYLWGNPGNLWNLYKPVGSTDLNLLSYGAGGNVMTFKADTGNVGVGTASPTSKLHLYGSNTYTNPLLYLQSISGGAVIGLRHPSATVDWEVAAGNVVADDFAILRNHSSLVYINSDGNVGIGTTAPSYNLHVVGNIYASGNITCGGGNCGGGGGNVSGGYWNLNGSSLYPNSTSYNVGIGTTSPNYKLQVNNGSVAIYGDGGGFAFRRKSASGVSLWYLDHDNTDAYISNEAVGAMILRTSATERMRITSTGSVGIGTTSPAEKLSVRNASAGINDLLGLQYGALSGDGGNINFKIEGGAVVGQLQQQMVGSGVYTMRLKQWDGSGLTERMTILGNGNVGIGTTSPGAKLEVNGVIKAQNDYPIRQQMVNRRVIFGYAGDTGLDYSNTWATVRPVVYGPFCYAVPSVQSGATRKYRVYAIYSDGLTTGNNQVWFDLDDGTDYYFNLPLTWGGVGSNNRDAYSDWYTGQPSCTHGVVKIQTTVAGSGKLWYMELQTWDFFG